MKIALVHDYIKEYGGAERVLEALHELYPNAPVYTSIYFPQFLGPHRNRFDGWIIKTSWLQMIPFSSRFISIIRLISPLIFKGFDFSSYDIIVTSATGAYFPNSLNKGKAKLICYCHTPPRYLYGYSTAREWKNNIFLRIIGEIANHFLRLVDFKAAQNVDYFIANSKEVAGRIRKFYRRESEIINPPVEIKILDSENIKHILNLSDSGYFVAGGRLARPKNIQLIIKACTSENIPIYIFGKGFAGYGKELHNIAGKTVKFLGEITDSEKYTLMTKAKAYIFASEDEDFGITPVEAMSCGIPVIAYRSGGVMETVIDEKNGIFFDSLTENSLIEALKKFERKTWEKKAIMKYAEKYSKARFLNEVKEFISNHA